MWNSDVKKSVKFPPFSGGFRNVCEDIKQFRPNDSFALSKSLKFAPSDKVGYRNIRIEQNRKTKKIYISSLLQIDDDFCLV